MVPKVGQTIHLSGFLRSQGRRQARFDLQLDRLELANSPQILALVGRELLKVEADDPQAVRGLQISWQGGFGGANAASQPTIDPELQKRLEALGYIQ